MPHDFVVHSFHCFFVLAGDGGTPVLYHVERVREGRSFATRTVQARQRGRPIFTVTCSFVREGSGGARAVAHAAAMPPDAGPPPPDDYDAAADPGRPGFWGAGADDGADGADGDDDVDVDGEKKKKKKRGRGAERDGRSSSSSSSSPSPSPSPFESYRIRVFEPSPGESPPQDKKARQWVRARGRISDEGGHQAHLSALAYISDSYFIGSVARFHRLWRFPVAPDDVPGLSPRARARLDRTLDWGGDGAVDDFRGRPELGMMVSLDQ